MKKTNFLVLMLLVFFLFVGWYSSGLNVERTDGKIEFSAAGETMKYTIYYDADNDKFVIESSDTDGSQTAANVAEIADGGKDLDFDGEVNLTFFSETVSTGSTDMSGTQTFDLADGAYHTGTLTGATEFDLDGWTSGESATMRAELVNAGAQSLTWDSAITWEGGTAPTLAESGTDILEFESRDGGTTIYGRQLHKPTDPGTVVSLGSDLSGTKAIDIRDGGYQYGTITGATTLTFTGWTSGEAAELMVELVDAGAVELTATSVQWAGGTEPSWTASGTDIFSVFSRDGGTTLHGRSLVLDSQ